MALEKKRDPQREALILEAAAEVRRINPRIGDARQPLSDEEYVEEQRTWQELERM